MKIILRGAIAMGLLTVASAGHAATIDLFDNFSLFRVPPAPSTPERLFDYTGGFNGDGANERLDSEDPNSGGFMGIPREGSDGFYTARSFVFGNFTQETVPRFGSDAEIVISDATLAQMRIQNGGRFTGVYAKGADTIPFRISGTSLEIGGHTSSTTAIAEAGLSFGISVGPIDGSSTAPTYIESYSAELSAKAINAGDPNLFIQAGTGPAKLVENVADTIPLSGTFETAAATNFDAEPWAKYTYDVYEGVLDVSAYEVGEEFQISYFWEVHVQVHSDFAYAKASYYDPLNPNGSFIDLSGHTEVLAGGTPDPVVPGTPTTPPTTTPPPTGDPISPVPLPASAWFLLAALLGLRAMFKKHA